MDGAAASGQPFHGIERFARLSAQLRQPPTPFRDELIELIPSQAPFN
jgi:hypothetical protein